MKIKLAHLDFKVKVKNQELFDKTFIELKKMGFHDREAFRLAIKKILKED